MLLSMVVATIAAGVFTGAALYITFVEHPARLECGPRVAVAEFRPSYRRAAVMQASLALLGMIGAGASWSLGARAGWLVWGLILGSLVPFTLLFILPTNRRLIDPDLDGHSAEAAPLLARWGRLHAVRTAAAVAVFVSFVIMLATR